MAIKLNARETELKTGKKPNPSLMEGLWFRTERKDALPCHVIPLFRYTETRPSN